jgi:hypothetical protein
MANTRIQVKRSTTTNQPSGSSLSIAEPAYSYVSNTLFIGTSDGTGVLPIGGFDYITKSNSAYTISIAAFDKANTFNNVYTTIAGANTAVGAGANAFTSATIAGANTDVGTGANAFTSATIAGANATVGTGANAFTSATISGANTAVGAGANNYANGTFVKLTAPQQTITGNLSVTGSLTVSGNAFSIDTETLRVSDPLIYLAGNNYVSDTVDIGFVGHYANATGSNVHTGFFRDHLTKEYYIFQGYDQEPNPNHIDPTGNNFTLSVLNADIRTSNLNLGGQNTINWITAAFDKANTFNNVYTTIAGANTAVGTGANAFTSATIAGANTAVGTGANAFTSATIAGANTAVGAGANSYADVVGVAANTNAANASYLTTGTVPSGRITGSYTGITGVGILTTGVWNGSTVTVPYGGTGATSFTANGILYGDGTNSIKVTDQGSDGNLLQTDANGRPFFGILDGGNF